MSFQQGLSGLNASNQNLEVIGNNIANASTYGAKSATAEFSTVYAAALNGGSSNVIGIGTTVSAVAQQFTQGNITTTSNPMDLAINGNGFFQVTNSSGQTQYTRNGQFNADANGNIVNSSGQQVLGYAATASGAIQSGTVVPLQLPTGDVSPAATTTMSLQMNLNSTAAVTVPASGAAINYGDPGTYNNATSQTIYDAKGQSVALTYYFQKATTSATGDTWNVFATAGGVDVGSGTAVSAGTPSPLPGSPITFSPDGSTVTSPTTPLAISIPANPTTGTLAINATLDISKSTEFGTAFGVTAAPQNGYAAGQLTGVSISSNGIITANYSNNQSVAAGQIVMANFRNPQGLQPVGNNNWSATLAAGTPTTGVPGDGNLGVLQSGALEESNVDLTNELVNMITAQRVYQANAQTIKTQDQVMQTLVNLR